MKPAGEAADDLRNAVHELGRALRDALHLEQIVGWLNDRLTRR